MKSHNNIPTMKTLTIISLFAAVGLLFLPNIVHSEEAKLPTNKKELEAWLSGTEWVTTTVYKNKRSHSHDMVRRFKDNGVMLYQNDTSKWKDNNSTRKGSYKVIGSRRLAFGVDKYIVVLNDDGKSFKGRSDKIKGFITGRIIVNIRIWTDNDGNSFNGELISSDGTTVKIRRSSDGKKFDILINTFSDADQRYIKVHQKIELEPDKMPAEPK